MNNKIIAAAATVVALAVSTAAPAQAYTLHTWSDGTITWMCNDGITVGVMDDGSMPPESVVIAACADHGGISTGPTGTAVTIERHLAPSPAGIVAPQDGPLVRAAPVTAQSIGGALVTSAPAVQTKVTR